MPSVPRARSPEVSLARARAVVGGGDRGRSRSNPRTWRRATTPTCVRSASSPSCSAPSGSCPTSRWRSATSASRPARSRTSGRRPSVSAVRPSSGRGRSSSSARRFVALNFAELSSHFPVAGSIYQWSKRLSNRTLGWFTGWIYFWAGVDHGHGRRGDRAARRSPRSPGCHQARRSVADPVAATCSRSSASSRS